MQTYKVVKSNVYIDGKLRKPGEKLELHPTNALTLAFLHFQQIEPVNMPFTPQPAVVAQEAKAAPVPVSEPAPAQHEKPYIAKATASQVIAEFKTKFRGK